MRTGDGHSSLLHLAYEVGIMILGGDFLFNWIQDSSWPCTYHCLLPCDTYATERGPFVEWLRLDSHHSHDVVMHAGCVVGGCYGDCFPWRDRNTLVPGCGACVKSYDTRSGVNIKHRCS